MEIVEHPRALPACCFFCPGSVRPWYVDTGGDIEFHGALYICNECLTHMGHLANFATPEEAETLRLDLAFAKKNEYELQVQVTALEKAINELTRVGYSPGRFIDSDPSYAVPLAVDNGGTQAGEESLGTGTGETPEPSNDEGVDELRSVEQPTDEFRIFE